jgi:hypothetical protein
MATRSQELEAEDLIAKTFDASDAKQVNNARKKAAKEKAEERETLEALMEYPNGRALMFNSVKCILIGSPLTPNDPYSTYFNLGQEHRARELFKEIVKIAPEEFTLMIEENKEFL